MIDDEAAAIVRNCCREIDRQVDASAEPEELTGEERLSWTTPPILVSAELGTTEQFVVEFERTFVGQDEPANQYVTVSLLLVVGDSYMGPIKRQPGIFQLLAKLDELNRNHPGVKFRFEPSSSDGVGGWVAVETDIWRPSLDYARLWQAINRLMDCAEDCYYMVYDVFQSTPRN